MRINTTIGSFALTSDMRVGVDCSIAVTPYETAHLQPEAFGLPSAAAAPFTSGGFVASVDAGASINCAVVSSMCAHSNGTHTECVGHVLPGRVTLGTFAQTFGPPGGIFPAVLLSVRPETLEASGDAYAPGLPGDKVISYNSISRALDALSARLSTAYGSSAAAGAPHAMLAAGGALCLRSWPNTSMKKLARWTGANAPYPTPSAINLALALGAAHIVIDLPSLDREVDGGAMLSHRAWWALPPRPFAGDASATKDDSIANSGANRLATELAYFPDDCDDGLYFVNIAVAPIDLDAAPSRLTLHAAEIVNIGR